MKILSKSKSIKKRILQTNSLQNVVQDLYKQYQKENTIDVNSLYNKYVQEIEDRQMKQLDDHKQYLKTSVEKIIFKSNHIDHGKITYPDEINKDDGTIIQEQIDKYIQENKKQPSMKELKNALTDLGLTVSSLKMTEYLKNRQLVAANPMEYAETFDAIELVPLVGEDAFAGELMTEEALLLAARQAESLAASRAFTGILSSAPLIELAPLTFGVLGVGQVLDTLGIDNPIPSFQSVVERIENIF